MLTEEQVEAVKVSYYAASDSGDYDVCAKLEEAFPELNLPDAYTAECERAEANADPGDMDGDAASALSSAGFGTDEDYGGGDNTVM